MALATKVDADRIVNLELPTHGRVPQLGEAFVQMRDHRRQKCLTILWQLEMAIAVVAFGLPIAGVDHKGRVASKGKAVLTRKTEPLRSATRRANSVLNSKAAKAF
ncbi:hypothetical protein [Cupriavidus taiwanensis]|uniref:hypothetical protein n=1 Tax=Cupriavidus taiwanensis TaxID=164546 RepID=UPI003521B16C